MKRLDGKVCLLTGAAHGIGAATAKALVAQGARLLATDLDEDAGQAVVKDLTDAGADAVFHRHDVASESDWADVFSVLKDRFGRLDVLVNNAGLGTYNDIETVSLEDFRRVMSINVDGTFIGTQMAIRTMKETGGGSIVNVASVASFIGAPTLAAYSASKGAVLMLTKSAATYCGTRGYGIRVNAIHPGLVDTRAGVEMARMATGAASNEEALAMFTQLHPIGRIGQPKEIADGIIFLASDESSFMTGSSLVVDGGYTAL